MRLDHDAIIFDCDGTLVDTEHSWNRAYQQLFTSHGARLDPQARTRLVGLQLHDLGQALAELLGIAVPPEELGRRVYDLVRTNAGDGVHAQPGAVELATALHGITPMAIATNTPTKIVDDYLTGIGIRHCFETIIDSATAGHPKPHPAPYQHACAHLGVPAQRTIAIEDSATGARSAHAAGLTVIAVPSHPDLTYDAHHRFPTLSAPRLWQLLGLTAPNTAKSTPLGHTA